MVRKGEMRSVGLVQCGLGAVWGKHLGWLEWIVLRESDVEEEDATVVGGVGRTHDGRHPFVYVVTLGTR